MGNFLPVFPKFFIPKPLLRPSLFLWVCVIGLLSAVNGQAVYNMTNARVDDCKGTLLGSNNGAVSGHYDHNENYTFTICVPGAKSITMSFIAFCTELDYDSLRLFDGPNIASPQIGPAYSGNGIPPTISTTGPCLTINFISDANVTCTGWIANWTTQIDIPPFPALDLNLMPTCSTGTMTVTFDRPIHCDSVNAGAFSITGQLPNTVMTATPVNCTNDSTTMANLTFTPGLDQSGFYYITYSSFYIDQCDSVWTLITTDSVAVRDCPLEVMINANNDTICEGDCATLVADAEGGDFLTYSFSWSNGAVGPGPHNVCPITTTTYSVTVSDGAGSTPATDNITIVVLPAPTMPPPQSICETAAPITLNAGPAGGRWSGPGITSAVNGTFDPGVAGAGTHIVTYTAPNGCSGEATIVVRGIFAGPVQAACPGTPAFQLQGATPPGGTWSGPNVTPFGVFTPTPTRGIFRLQYDFNGCIDSMTVYVDTITLMPVDTVCESLNPFNFTFYPPGGFWQGTGITNTATGRFDPVRAGLGNHTMVYFINGCNKFFDIYVKEIDVGPRLWACPLQPAFLLPAPTPAGGMWTGPGIINAFTGQYNPANLPNNRNDTLIYNVDGCDAELVVRVRHTTIGNDTMEFCPPDPPIDLNWANMRRSPSNGVWSGPGITSPSGPGEFDPPTAGPGNHTILYVANTCSATATMIVHPYSLLGDTSLCEGSPPFNLRNRVPGGVWSGNGITDVVLGTFDPVISGVGVHTVYYLPPTGCLDSLTVTVYLPPVPSISNLDVTYCYKDTNIFLVGMPAGGIFTGPGISGSVFNPSVAGPGQHFINYSVGDGPCERMALAVTNVGDPMQISVPLAADTICAGEYVTISADAQGGSTGNFTYTWMPGGIVGNSIAVNPDVTTVYTVTATDGCTDPVSDIVRIEVSPPFSLRFDGSGPGCYGDSGYAVVIVDGPSTYFHEWHTIPPVFDDTLSGVTGFNIGVTVTDLESGCEESGLTDIISYPYVHAKFSANPNGECKHISDPTFDFIDLSSGGVTGRWDFGDGTVEEYIEGVPIKHTYPGVGVYEVKLFIENEGSCSDSAIIEVCVIPDISAFYVPTAFSPNGDGKNDIFRPKGVNVLTYNLKIFNRWGNLIFESNNMSEGWDGTYKGADAPEGVYIFVIRGSITANSQQNNYAPQKLEREGNVTLIR